MPVDEKVNATSGTFEWNDTFVLSVENGVTANTDLVLEAKVWGEKEGEGEEIETVQFHVQP
jgi:hypothetical protein